ncbi:hypothetical protein [Duganella sp. P38]|uniref:hypothetical protein n=1 Tax=Duganella sp. P38 TaxID=3423949 RepID=UPI003D7B5547
MTNRRQFLSVAALGLASSPALADSLTYQSFHAALDQNARLSVYADHSGDLSGEATVLGSLPADLNGVFTATGRGASSWAANAIITGSTATGLCSAGRSAAAK